jgi:hypothetical protein
VEEKSRELIQMQRKSDSVVEAQWYKNEMLLPKCNAGSRPKATCKLTGSRGSQAELVKSSTGLMLNWSPMDRVRSSFPVAP